MPFFDVTDPSLVHFGDAREGSNILRIYLDQLAEFVSFFARPFEVRRDRFQPLVICLHCSSTVYNSCNQSRSGPL